jgi:hypothetical protein
LAFADELAKAPIELDNRTSISAGIAFAATTFAISGLISHRRTIDVSGDGANNDGPSLSAVRDRVVKDGININGLPILLDPSASAGLYVRASLQDYYEDCVIGGRGAFVIPIFSVNDFRPAILRKLILEIAEVTPGAAIVPVVDTVISDPPKVDCLLVEATRPGGGP